MIKKATLNVIVFCGITLGISACIFTSQYASLKRAGGIDMGNHQMDPNTILQNIENGAISKSLFDPEYDLDIPREEKDLIWGQDDFLIIAKTFHRLWAEQPGEEWKLLGVEYKVRCRDFPKYVPDSQQNQIKWQRAQISYYLTWRYPENNVAYRVINEVFVSPNLDNVSYSQTHYDPNPFRPDIELQPWGELDISSLKITAEGAFTLAQAAGGADFVGGAKGCDVLVRNSTIDKYDGWHVEYFKWDGHPEYIVDDQTGEIQDITEDD